MEIGDEVRLCLADKIVHLQVAGDLAAQQACTDAFYFKIALPHRVTRADVANVSAQRRGNYLQGTAAEPAIDDDQSKHRRIRLGLILQRSVSLQNADRQGSVLQSFADLSSIEESTVRSIHIRMYEVSKSCVKNELRVAAVKSRVGQLELLRSDLELGA